MFLEQILLGSLLDIRDSYKEGSFKRDISLTAYRRVLKTLSPWPRSEDRLMAAAIFSVNLLLQQQKTTFQNRRAGLDDFLHHCNHTV